MNADDLKKIIEAISERLNRESKILNQLDSALGDGDHGTGVSTAFAAAVEQLKTMQAASPAEVLRITANTLMNRMGGTSGALYGTLFLRASSQVKDVEVLSLPAFAAMWRAGCEGVKQRGKAALGDKTMLDALIPAVEQLEVAANEGADFPHALQRAAQNAQAGAASTEKMIAKFGRAKFVGERAIGHMDAGAYSTALMFDTIYEYWEREHGET